MLVISLMCLLVLFLFVFIAIVLDGIDFAGVTILVLVGIPLATVISLLFNV